MQGANQGWKEKDHGRYWYVKVWDWIDKDRYHKRYIPPQDMAKGQKSSPINPEMFRSEDFLARILMCVEEINTQVRGFRKGFSELNQMVTFDSDSINKLETQMGQISAHLCVMLRVDCLLK